MKTYEIILTVNWVESEAYYIQANSHKELSETLPNKNKRIFNERFREIERTGSYYRISETSKNGKCFIFELL